MTSYNDYNELKTALLDKYFGFLNPEQRKAVYTTEGPLLVLAGAGSGKTTVIVNRIANLILFGRASSDGSVPENAGELLPSMRYALEHGDSDAVRETLKKCAVDPVFPYRILCITFTNKAANEFRARLSSLLGEDADDIWAGTFHSICVKILRRYIDRIGYKNDFTIYDADDSKRLVTKILAELNIAEHVISPKNAVAMISRAKENCRTPADEAGLSSSRDVRARRLCEVYEHYQKALRSANALDFDDIIMLTIRLFEDAPDVLDKCRERFKYILVDEYQDTNRSQSRLVAQLAGKRRNVCVVGDDDQSIYSFRGAVIDNILGFDLEYPDAKIIRLEQNYRSTGNILKAANGIIKNNAGRKGKELWTSLPDGDPVHIVRRLSQNEEAEFICDTIDKGVDSGKRYSDYAVLYRVNAMSNSLETAFAKNRIPYKVFGGLKFFERREIKDVLAYLSVITNNTDAVRLRRIINVPKRSIGDATVEKIETLASQRGVPAFEIIKASASIPELQRVSSKLLLFAELIESLYEYSLVHTVSETVSHVIYETGYVDMVAEEEGGDEREQNIMELISSAKLYEETAEDKSLAAFLNEIALVSDLDGYDSGDDYVVLMTVHSAKGLEFGNVFIPGFEEGLFPSSQSLFEGDKGLEEERRLAYVAVTRAKRSLYLIHTDNRMLYGRTDARQISRFASEIPEGCRDRIGGGSAPSRSVWAADYPVRSEKRSTFFENVRNAAKPNAEAEFIPEGTRVRHPMFGEGGIIKATPMGGDVLYEIEFDNGSTKRLMGNFAKLKRI
ncbi:MAG: UvrD-helicase domain-containing protein [Clostridia bacterium]|nr:UvrD-helicase domain-containing protein [Clostridia bacterium]